HFAFGETDAFVILDMPDNESAAAASLAVSATGAATAEVIVLLTPEQLDQAMRRSPDYRAPGA
ncbi:MAG: GYD domain-containing protein, partial [Solirubrobacteraceae bacterium]